MKRLLLSCLLALGSMAAHAQSLDIDIAIDPTAGQKQISPLIYGINAYVYDSEWKQSSDWKVGLDNAPGDINIVSRRLGGNTMTSYNWENGFSNSGNDDNHSNNNFQSFIVGAGDGPYPPGAALSMFHDHSTLLGAPYSLLQLPAAGYVAADNNGAVSQAEAAPSPRWKEVVFDKPGSPGSLSLLPDLNDDQVYVDEEINFLKNNFGSASSGTGIRGYELDNEPGLWHLHPDPVTGDAGTHSRLHAEETTCSDVIMRNIALAKTVKRMDPAAETFGPAMYGYSEYYSLWSVYDPATNTSYQPSDWGNYTFEPYLTHNTGDAYRYNHMTWVNVYLDHMKIASDGAGTRLLDAFSAHYYPAGIANDADRVQAPRSLWDPTYVENSYITAQGNGFTDGRGLQLIPKFQQSIADFYPGTKLAFTEYSFEGRHSVTGGIAESDALGIFGKYGVYLATYFFTVDDYIASAFKIYRNYDGQNSTFGDTSVACTTSDVENSSAYASVDRNGDLHIIVINKNATRRMNAHVSIAQKAYATGHVWRFDGSSSAITNAGSIDPGDNLFTYDAPPYSVSHIVLRTSTSSVPATSGTGAPSMSVAPNPFNSQCRISYTGQSEKGSIWVIDMLGNLVSRMPVQGNAGSVQWDGRDMRGNNCPAGVYTVTIGSGTGIVHQKVVLAR